MPDIEGSKVTTTNMVDLRGVPKLWEALQKSGRLEIVIDDPNVQGYGSHTIELKDGRMTIKINMGGGFAHYMENGSLGTENWRSSFEEECSEICDAKISLSGRSVLRRLGEESVRIAILPEKHGDSDYSYISPKKIQNLQDFKKELETALSILSIYCSTSATAKGEPEPYINLSIDRFYPIDKDSVRIGGPNLRGEQLPSLGHDGSMLPRLEAISPDKIIGQEDANKELLPVRLLLSNPDAARKWGVDLPRTVLISGPESTGRSLLARSLAETANIVTIEASSLKGGFLSILFGGPLDILNTKLSHIAADQTGQVIVILDDLESLVDKLGSFNSTPAEKIKEFEKFLEDLAKNEGLKHLTLICLGGSDIKIVEPLKEAFQYSASTSPFTSAEAIELLKRILDDKEKATDCVLYNRDSDFSGLEALFESSAKLDAAVISALVEEALRQKALIQIETESLLGYEPQPISGDDLCQVWKELQEKGID